MAALLAGQSFNEIAKEYKLPPATVRSWKRTLPEFMKRQREVASTQVQREKQESIDSLVERYLREILTTLQVQAAFFRERPFLEKQSGADLAVNHGVLADKGFRILAAAESDTGPDDSGGAPTGNI